jgi:uroporphyrinogen-III synthase
MHKQLLAGLRVWITRPLEQSEPLQSALQALGAECTVVPMTIIENKPLTEEEASLLRSLTRVDALIFTSRNAVLHSQVYWPTLISLCDDATYIFALGEGTKQQLQDAGISSVIIPEGQFNSETLLNRPELQQVKSHQIVIVSGEGGRDQLEQILRQRQANPLKLAVYRRQCPPGPQQKLENVEVVVLTSGEGLTNFFQMYGVQHLQKLPLVVISDRMAALARRHGFEGVVIQATHATTDSIVKAIIQWKERVSNDGRT